MQIEPGKLRDDHRDYLLRRGYLLDDIQHEEVCSLEAGEWEWEHVQFATSIPLIAFLCRSPAGTPAGIHTCNPTEKGYQYHPDSEHLFLPILYGSAQDYRLLFDGAPMLLSEGIFDRAAMKRIYPEMANFARLSKGVSNQLAHFIRRYTELLYLAFDQDSAGQKATVRTTNRLGEYISVLELRYPAKDPAEFRERYGERRARELLDLQRVDLSV